MEIGALDYRHDPGEPCRVTSGYPSCSHFTLDPELGIYFASSDN